MPVPDPSRLLAELALMKLLAELPAGVQPFTVQTRMNGLAGVLRIGAPADLPLAETRDELTARQRECLEAVQVEIARLGRRVIGSEVRSALKAAGIRWGVSTINTALADLVDRGLLVNDNDKKGYGLPEEAHDSG